MLNTRGVTADAEGTAASELGVQGAGHQRSPMGTYLLSNPSRCFNSFRMQPENFIRSHTILTSKYGLESRMKIDYVEVLGMFLWACGTNQYQRQMEERFERG
jgi:hypothetical protein